MARKTPEEIAEENRLTSEVGLFNYADSYLSCAKQLINSPPPYLRFTAPIEYLLFHAAELYLKSYLRQKGEDLDALKKLSHYYQRMFDKAAKFGMNLPPEIYNLFEFLDQTDAVIENRYIRTGLKEDIDTSVLLPAVEEVRARVKMSHELAGVTLAAPWALAPRESPKWRL
jgi:hypothetical protein